MKYTPFSEPELSLWPGNSFGQNDSAVKEKGATPAPGSGWLAILNLEALYSENHVYSISMRILRLDTIEIHIAHS